MIMTEERYKFLQAFVLGTDEARELFEFERDELLSSAHRPNENDPYNEGAKIAMAVAETYQYFINIHNHLKKGIENGTDSNGNPTI